MLGVTHLLGEHVGPQYHDSRSALNASAKALQALPYASLHGFDPQVK